MRIRTPMLACAGAALLCVAAGAQQRLPYRAVDNPQFVPAARVNFLQPQDRVIGLVHNDVARAYPAAILAQHGVVNDMMPDGPIAITW
ncbi:MAG TPA: DUF3179 domain-containing (seleno)protein [Terriglobales bacterium]|nr:DUF3179 domain-containing (seleno)protein [Terriglobales bacterium]